MGLCYILSPILISPILPNNLASTVTLSNRITSASIHSIEWVPYMGTVAQQPLMYISSLSHQSQPPLSISHSFNSSHQTGIKIPKSYSLNSILLSSNRQVTLITISPSNCRSLSDNSDVFLFILPFTTRTHSIYPTTITPERKEKIGR